jgi:ADP-heptose:LPS heptosyltransferase
VSRPSPSRRLRKRLNRRLYRLLFRGYRALFPTPAWTGPVSRDSLRRILVVQHYGVGDMILTTPLLAYLKEELPGADIDVLASPRNSTIIADHPAVARVFIHDHTWRGWLRVLPQLRARRYDAIFTGQAGKGLREGLTASLVAHSRTHKISIWRAKRYQGLFTMVTRAPRHATQTAEQVLHLGLHALGVTPSAATLAGRRYPLRMAADEHADARVDAYLAEREIGSFVAVNLSAHFVERDWAPEHCARFVGQLLDRHANLVVVLTPAPGKEGITADVARRCANPRVTVAPVFPLPELASLVRRATAVVSTNTALVHLASACGRPVVALYAPKVPADVTLWLPIGVPYRALASPLGRAVRDIPSESITDAFDDLSRETAGHSEAAAEQLVP